VAAGSSLKFCWVAEGRADLYPRFGPTMEWDVAAGDCVYRNAAPNGAHTSPLTYNKPDLRNDSFVIASAASLPTTHGIEPAGQGAGAVLWFTGLSGSGKSTIAQRVLDVLRHDGQRVEQLDGDAIRDVFPQTGFSRAERDAHVRRVGYLASRLEHHGVVVVASLISPYAESRSFVRGLCSTFIEIHIATPLAECERRDVKGLYARARRGEIANFTGLDDPYEPPASPELVIDTRAISVDQAATLVLERLSEARTHAPGPSPRTRDPQRQHPAGSLRELQAAGHAVVDRQG
jgi:adenylylsulfate kinase